MKFKKLTDGRGFELAEYVKDFLVRHKDYEVKIYLGCDSQNKSTNTTYATTVVFHIENTGCHVIYKKEVMTEIKDMWTRLWMECEKSVEAALVSTRTWC